MGSNKQSDLIWIILKVKAMLVTQWQLPLFSVKHTVTFSAAQHHCPLTRNKLYCLVTEAQG